MKLKKLISIILVCLLLIGMFSTLSVYAVINTQSNGTVYSLKASDSNTVNDYYVAGEAGLCNGVSWNEASVKNKMTKNADGSYEITYYGINPKEDGSTYQFKVVTNGKWSPAYGYEGLIADGGANQELTVTKPNSTVKIVLTSELKVKVYINETENLTINGKCGDNLKWTLNSSGTLEISGTGKMYDYNRFASVEDSNYIPWKEYRQQIKYVIISEGVTSIGAYAFYGRNRYGADSEQPDSLLSVSLPNSLSSIGHSAFFGCKSLQSIKIPKNVTSIDAYAFLNCIALKNIDLPDDLEIISESCFEGCISLKSIKLPKKLIAICHSAFSGSGLESININNNIKYICSFAFAYCENLKSVIVEEDIYLQGSEFLSCSKLESITFNGKITLVHKTPYNESYGSGIFESCPMLKKAVLPSFFEIKYSYDGDTDGKKYPIQSYGNFDNSDNLKLSNITFNDNPKIINGVVFSTDGKTLLWYPDNLTVSSYTIPRGVQTLAYSSFANQTYIRHINIPDSVTQFDGRVFSGCSNLDNVIIPDSVTTLFDFQNCKSLRSIYIPNSVIKMYQSGKESLETFENCENLVIYCDKNSYAENFAKEYSFVHTESVYCHFDSNEGKAEYNKQPVIPSDIYWNLPKATKNNYNFAGWYTSKIGGNKITENDIVTKDESYMLYAHWSKKSDTPKPTPKKSQTISAKSFTKYYGDKSFSLGAKAKTKLTYKSSNNSVATVSSNGKVTIKGIGKATITISAVSNSKYKSATKKITVNVKLKSVNIKSIKVKKLSGNSLKVYWSKVSNINGYQINIATSNINNGRKQNKTNVVLNRARKGLKIKFSVRTYKKIGKKSFYSDWTVRNIVFK